LRTLKSFVEEENDKARFKIAKKLQSYARRYHRYKHKTRTLMRSTVPVYGDNAISITATAEYATFVINGHGTWAPDQFLENALYRNREFVKNQYKTVVARGVAAFNRQNKRG
jgi:hypothetical protein